MLLMIATLGTSLVSRTLAAAVIPTALAAAMTGTTATAVISAALAAAMTGTTATAVISTALAITMAGATATAPFGTTTGRKFGTGSRISLHIVGIVTQLANFRAQLLGIGLLRVVGDGQLGRLLVVGVGFHALEIRHILFEFVGTLLADTVGLDRHGLFVLRGRLLGTHTQRDEAH